MMTRADVECFAELLMRTQRWEPKDEKGGIFLEFTTEGDSYEQKTMYYLVSEPSSSYMANFIYYGTSPSPVSVSFFLHFLCPRLILMTFAQVFILSHTPLSEKYDL